jgi:hypothetical protein
MRKTPEIPGRSIDGPTSAVLRQWNSAERASHCVVPPRNEVELQGVEVGGLQLVSVGGERLHRRAKHRAIEALMLGVRENDENLRGDWPPHRCFFEREYTRFAKLPTASPGVLEM